MEKTVFFYEFNEAPYYGLIMATNTFEALKTYHEVISDIEPTNDVLPDEVGYKKVLSKLAKSESEDGNEIGTKEAKEQLEDFKQSILEKLTKEGETCGECLLIDGSLV